MKNACLLRRQKYKFPFFLSLFTEAIPIFMIHLIKIIIFYGKPVRGPKIFISCIGFSRLPRKSLAWVMLNYLRILNSSAFIDKDYCVRNIGINSTLRKSVVKPGFEPAPNAKKIFLCLYSQSRAYKISVFSFSDICLVLHTLFLYVSSFSFVGELLLCIDRDWDKRVIFLAVIFYHFLLTWIHFLVLRFS